MVQNAFVPIDDTTTDGSALATDVNAKNEAFISTHSGPSQPPSARGGQLWLDTSLGTSDYRLKMHTGAGNIDLFRLDFPNQVGRANTGLQLLSSALKSTANTNPMVVAADVTGYDVTMLEVVGVGKVPTSDGASIWLEWATDQGGGAWQTATAGLSAQNTVVQGTHITTAPLSSGKFLLNNADSGWVSGRWHHTFASGSPILTMGGHFDLLLNTGMGTAQYSYGFASGVPINSYRITCSVAFEGLLRLWGLPND